MVELTEVEVRREITNSMSFTIKKFMKLGKFGIGRKPDMSIDSTRSFRVLGQHG